MSKEFQNRRLLLGVASISVLLILNGPSRGASPDELREADQLIANYLNMKERIKAFACYMDCNRHYQSRNGEIVKREYFTTGQETRVLMKSANVYRSDINSGGVDQDGFPVNYQSWETKLTINNRLKYFRGLHEIVDSDGKPTPGQDSHFDPWALPLLPYNDFVFHNAGRDDAVKVSLARVLAVEKRVAGIVRVTVLLPPHPGWLGVIDFSTAKGGCPVRTEHFSGRPEHDEDLVDPENWRRRISLSTIEWHKDTASADFYPSRLHLYGFTGSKEAPTSIEHWDWIIKWQLPFKLELKNVEDPAAMRSTRLAGLLSTECDKPDSPREN